MLTFLFFPPIICICRGCHRWSQQVKWLKPVVYRLGLKDVNWAEAVRRRRAVAVARPARAISNTSLSATDLCFNCLWAVAVPAAARPVVPVVPAPELASVYPEEPQIPINAPALLQPVLNYYSTHTHKSFPYIPNAKCFPRILHTRQFSLGASRRSSRNESLNALLIRSLPLE